MDDWIHSYSHLSFERFFWYADGKLAVWRSWCLQTKIYIPDKVGRCVTALLHAPSMWLPHYATCYASCYIVVRHILPVEIMHVTPKLVELPIDPIVNVCLIRIVFREATADRSYESFACAAMAQGPP
jgi:hypothetical protein